MTTLLSLSWKNLVDARWALGPSILVLILMGYLGVYRTARLEREIRTWVEKGDFERIGRFARGLGLTSAEFPSAVIEVGGWNLPPILLVVILWAIGRGSSAVAGELERGTMDLVMTRPVPRSVYLLSHVISAAVGFLLLGAGLLAGHALGVQFYSVTDPPPTLRLIRPALNLAALGFSIFGITLVVSSMDRVRWRPNLVGTAFALGSFILLIVVTQPGLEDWKYLEHYSIFKAYNPVEVVTTGATFGPNLAVLLGLAVGTVAISLVAFGRRDLPAGAS